MRMSCFLHGVGNIVGFVIRCDELAEDDGYAAGALVETEDGFDSRRGWNVHAFDANGQVVARDSDGIDTVFEFARFADDLGDLLPCGVASWLIGCDCRFGGSSGRGDFCAADQQSRPPQM